MDARIGPTGAHRWNLAAEQKRKRILELVLHGFHAGLRLASKARKRRAVILHVERKRVREPSRAHFLGPLGTQRRQLFSGFQSLSH